MLLFSFCAAVVLCAAMWLYATLSDNHPILPVKILVAPAFMVGALISGNVHQPSAIGAWSVFLLYAWLLMYAVMAIFGNWFSKYSTAGKKLGE
jgi:hypothetical protein